MIISVLEFLGIKVCVILGVKLFDQFLCWRTIKGKWYRQRRRYICFRDFREGYVLEKEWILFKDLRYVDGFVYNGILDGFFVIRVEKGVLIIQKIVLYFIEVDFWERKYIYGFYLLKEVEYRDICYIFVVQGFKFLGQGIFLLFEAVFLFLFQKFIWDKCFCVFVSYGVCI